jgi:hypothetical protein
VILMHSSSSKISFCLSKPVHAMFTLFLRQFLSVEKSNIQKTYPVTYVLFLSVELSK